MIRKKQAKKTIKKLDPNEKTALAAFAKKRKMAPAAMALELVGEQPMTTETLCRAIGDNILAWPCRHLYEMLIHAIDSRKVTTTSGGSKGSTRTVSEASEPVIPPENLGNLGDDILIYANGKYLKGRRTVVYPHLSHTAFFESVGVKELRKRFDI